MTGFLGQSYLWINAVHVIAVITWMAGLFYLPRLFVYHAQVEATGAQSQTFKVMERRLLKAIMNPSLIVVWVLGLLLAFHLGAWDDGWFHAKLLLVLIMTGMHMLYARWRRQFEADQNTHGHRFYRVMNEVPTVLLVLVVILVKLKPF